MGVHTGQPLRAAEGYVGLDVHRAARIAAVAHGGQVVVSEATQLTVRRELVPLGTHRLKDLGRPQPLWQLGETRHPPLGSLGATNLPVQQTALLGRSRELEEVRRRLAERRIVTLVGAGGAGKTRLALQVAAEAADDYPHGVWWVPLQSVRDPGLVLPIVAQALGARGPLAEHVAGRQLLLLLDNVEQVVDVAPELSRLVGETRDLRLLVTSREPLRIAGEAEYRVEPLAVEHAAALFAERAGRADDPDVVHAICRRLDCLPLAVELAAARTTLFPAEELLRRLDRRLPLLTGGRRDAPERQRTLRATIAWSHDLLEGGERELFRRLAVFGGSFDVAAAEAICGAEVDALQSLVEKSLVRRWGSGRLGMLETVHEFALERLQKDDAAALVHERHARWYADLAEHLHADLWDAGHERAIEIFDAEHSNLREAAAWASVAGESDLLLRLCAATGEYWVIAGHLREGADWLDRALAASPTGEATVRAPAFAVSSALAYLSGDYERAERHAAAALALYRSLGDVIGLCDAVTRRANARHGAGDRTEARASYEDAVELARRGGAQRWIGISLLNLAVLDFEEERYREAAAGLDEAGRAFAAARNASGVAAARLFGGLCALGQGDLPEALDRLRESISLYRDLGRRARLAPCLEALAAAARERGDREAAERLFGAAEVLREETGARPTSGEQRVRALALRSADPAASEFVAQGRELTLDAAVEYALAVASEPAVAVDS
jgi:predicted ATPase